MEALPSPLSSRAKPRDLQFIPPVSNADRSAAFPFVIPSEAEGSAVHSTGNQCWPKRCPLLCHPERSRGICSSFHQYPMLTEALLFPLSSRAKPRDLQFIPPVTNAGRSAAFPFVIPSEAEGPAVHSTGNQCWPKRCFSLCHPERSRGICSSFHQYPMLTEALLFPLSSRAKPRDLQFIPPVTNAGRSAAFPFVIPSEAEGSAVHSTSIQC